MNTQYHLRVQIGRRSQASLVQGDVPPLDPLLPEPDDSGHVLHVAVCGLDFDVREPAMQRLILPTLGEAIVDFRRGLLREHNPLGFVFTPYGEADLTLESSTAAAPALAEVHAGS